ncbi:MAG TPA: calcium-binding protein, partial [Allosphingosinicella sp.]|nr:calcium-binding protein [Allosphingosinicella sp.]
IEGNRLIVADNSRLDHETAPVASLTVRVTDANGNSFDEVLSIAVADSANEQRYTAQAEFATSTGSGSYGRASAIGALAGGGFVMTWTGAGDDPQAPAWQAIRGQLFDSAGAKVGSEFLVNTTVTGSQEDSAAAGLQGGGFVVVWSDGSGLGGDSSGFGIKGQRFDSSGAKAGVEFQVNTVTQNGQTDASVAGLASGGFVVTWTNYDDPYMDISVQLFDSAGAKVGGETVVNSASGFQAGNNFHPAVAALPNGGFVVTWTHSDGGRIMAQIFDPAGNKVGTDFAVAAGAPTYFPDNVAVAALASGGFVVSWSDKNPQGGDTSSYGIKAQIFDAAGAKVGGQLLVNTEIDGDQVMPAVAGLPWGGFVVSWQDDGWGDGSGSAIRAQIYDSLGGRIGGDFVVNAGADGDQAAPVLALLAQGGFAVGWQEEFSVDYSARNLFEGRVFSPTQADNSGDDILTGDANGNLLDGGAGNDQIYGNGGNDDLRGGTGLDRLRVSGTGIVTAAGGTDADYLEVDYGDSAAGITMTAPAADPNGGLAGSIGDGGARRIAYSGIENFNITTGSGNDHIRGGTGDNFVSLGAGGDLYTAGSGFNSVDAGVGVDGLAADFSAYAGGIFWNLGTGAHNLVGNYLNFEYFAALTTGSGQDNISTANVLANDVITLGANNDGAFLWNGHDVVNGGEAGAGATDSGFDTLVLNYGQATTAVHNVGSLSAGAAGYSGQFSDDFTRLATFEAIDRFLIATGSGADNIVTGSANDEVRTGGGNDIVDSGGGNDLIDGGSGDDSMTGGAGNDIYFVSSAGDLVLEIAGEGTDEVRTALATYVLAANVEKLTA